ncbi:MAG: hypothetical protein EPN50_10570 [Chloroflexota bacterium]|nr:MAG: hypothetical protein EPN50_10570 [Chloroflexota bacterium]
MKPPSQATQLVALGATAELFHDASGTAYATMSVAGHVETHPIRSSGFRSWLAGSYWGTCQTTPSSQALTDALGTLEGMARYDGADHEVHVRLAHADDALYVDLGDARWQAIAVTRDGWDLVATPPVRFRRPKSLGALPVPVRGGSLDELRGFLNLDGDDDEYVLLVGFLLAAFGRGPYLILVLGGEHGSAKTSTSRMLRKLIDPALIPDRAKPRDDRDLIIAATNGHLVAFDNLSELTDWISDGLARLATGAGFGARALYTDAEEAILYARKPTIINGIGDLATRPDLLDRAVLVNLPRIPDERRRSEDDLWPAFDAARPRLLGALFDALVMALRRERQVTLARTPRMADAARWVTAAAPALGWTNDTFVSAYARNRASGHELALEASSLASPIRDLIAAGPWEGTAAALLDRLAVLAGDAVARRKDWPAAPHRLSGQLRRLAPDLRAVGIEVAFDRHAGHAGRERIIRISMQRSAGSAGSAGPSTEPPALPGAPPALPVIGAEHESGAPDASGAPLHDKSNGLDDSDPELARDDDPEPQGWPHLFDLPEASA